ncbi:hypothetical protein SSX86_016114 [Deinandra increscens subsp. villosa]|uniref:DUF7950 domain-containing protein n=1 Tax=Deinandra increscens subsp. villosa TaxID=3103831 RepID=A0AAP0D245_9ASTR
MAGGKRRVENGCVIRRDPEEKMTMSQIMLRFRPIAPRPVTAVAVESSICTVPLKEARVKRKYVRIKKKKKMAEACNLKNLEMLEVNSNAGEFFVTDPVRRVPEWISFDVSGSGSSRINRIVGKLITPAPPSAGLHDVDLAVTVTRGEFVESWITMESVTGTTCEDGSLLGNRTDDKIRKDLETDSCPGFISDGCDRVEWVNHAYRRMVDPNRVGGAPLPEVLVWLGVKLEKSAFEYWPAFSCRVRVVFRLSSEKKMQVMTVPCDVWKMDSGGYAWRLDVKAALSLGRFN